MSNPCSILISVHSVARSPNFSAIKHIRDIVVPTYTSALDACHSQVHPSILQSCITYLCSYFVIILLCYYILDVQTYAGLNNILPIPFPLHKHHALKLFLRPLGLQPLDLGYLLPRVQPLGASPCAVHDGVAAIQLVHIIQSLQPFSSVLVSTVSYPSANQKKVTNSPWCQ